MANWTDRCRSAARFSSIYGTNADKTPPKKLEGSMGACASNPDAQTRKVGGGECSEFFFPTLSGGGRHSPGNGGPTQLIDKSLLYNTRKEEEKAREPERMDGGVVNCAMRATCFRCWNFPSLPFSQQENNRLSDVDPTQPTIEEKPSRVDMYYSPFLLRLLGDCDAVWLRYVSTLKKKRRLATKVNHRDRCKWLIEHT